MHYYKPDWTGKVKKHSKKGKNSKSETRKLYQDIARNAVREFLTDHSEKYNFVQFETRNPKLFNTFRTAISDLTYWMAMETDPAAIKEDKERAPAKLLEAEKKLKEGFNFMCVDADLEALMQETIIYLKNLIKNNPTVPSQGFSPDWN